MKISKKSFNDLKNNSTLVVTPPFIYDPKPPADTSPIHIFDLVVYVTDSLTVDKFKELLNRLQLKGCTAWVFQKERGNKQNTLHYQCHLYFNPKTRKTQVHNMLLYELKSENLFRVSTQSKTSLGLSRKKGYVSEYDLIGLYSQKRETRVEGPYFSDSLAAYTENYQNQHLFLMTIQINNKQSTLQKS